MYRYIHLWDENGGTKRSDSWILMTCVSQAETWAIKKESTLEKLPVLIVLLCLFLAWPHLLSKVMYSHQNSDFFLEVWCTVKWQVMFLIRKWNHSAVCEWDPSYQKGEADLMLRFRSVLNRSIGKIRRMVTGEPSKLEFIQLKSRWGKTWWNINIADWPRPVDRSLVGSEVMPNSKENVRQPCRQAVDHLRSQHSNELVANGAVVGNQASLLISNEL